MAPLEGPTVLADRYVLVEKVGEGGGGEVYRAWDRSLGLQVALKMLPEGMEHDAFVKRLKREIRVTRDIDHPGVARVYDLVEAEGRTFFTMRWLDGQSLHHAVRDHGPLGKMALRRLARGLIDALAAAHRLGVVHRDVKPSNVMVSPDGEPVLVDFGIATDTGDSPPALARRGEAITLSGPVPGTPAYMAPEQAEGTASGPASDLWALALTIAFAAEGRTGRPDAPARTFAPLGKGLSTQLVRCLEADPARRPRDAIALGEALSRTARRRRALVFVAVWLVALAAAAVTGLVATRDGAGGALGPPRVHVDAIADETGDPRLAWVAPGVADLLRAGIESSSRATLAVDPARDREAARISGRVRSKGGEPVVDLMVKHGGRTRARRSVAGGETLFVEVDAAMDALLDSLGAPRSGGSRQRPTAVTLPTSDRMALMHYVRALGEVRRHEYPAALRSLRSALARDGKFASAHLERYVLVTMRGVGSHAEAEASLRAARTNAERLGPAERAVLDALEASRRTPGPEPFRRLRAALRALPPRASAYRMGAVAAMVDRVDRQALLEEWAERIPDDPEPHNLLGYLFAGAGDDAAAEREFRQYLRLAPDDANAHDSYGDFLVGIGRLREATEAYDRALRIDPGFAAAALGAADAAAVADDLAGAERRLSSIDSQKISTSQLEQWVEGISAIPVLRGDVASAIGILDEIAQDPMLGSRAYVARAAQAILHGLSGDRRRARRAAEDADRMSRLQHGARGSLQVLVWYVEALAAERKGDRRGLERAASEIAEADLGPIPFLDEGRRILVDGFVLVSRGDPSTAAERLRAVETPPGTGGPRFMARLEGARALARAGRLEEADATYREAIDLRVGNWRSPEVAYEWDACLREASDVAARLGDDERHGALLERATRLRAGPQ